MSHMTRRRLGLLVAAVSAMLAIPSGAAASMTPSGLQCAPVVAGSGANAPTFHLVTGTGYTTTPDGNSVFMWSYSLEPSEANQPLVAGGPLPTFQTPGPNLCVKVGDSVTVTLHNRLPEPSSIIFPGQDSTITATGGNAGLLTREAPANGAAPGDVTYTFTATQPGTYIYESGSNMSKQLEMGLYGAIIVRPNAVPAGGAAGTVASQYAYNDSNTVFNPKQEYILLLAEIDPDLHHAVAIGSPYDATRLHNHYYTVNGRSFPDTIQKNGSGLLPNQPYGALIKIQPTVAGQAPALIRMLNVGTIPHPFHPHGNHTVLIAQDGRLITDPAGNIAKTEHFAETIGTGQTQDYTIRWDSADSFDPVVDPFPVLQPSYVNLTFKDSNTWYAGSPYLGYRGTLPVGTTSQNMCGEWYFPLHSHALNEFSNFDEGFGGMGTLLRVDPAGGCFGTPTATKITTGSLAPGGGTLASLTTAPTPFMGSTTLDGAVNTAAGNTIQIKVTTPVGFPNGNSFNIRIDNEVLRVIAGAGTSTWTVSRHQQGTVGGVHANGAIISQVPGRTTLSLPILSTTTTTLVVPTGTANTNGAIRFPASVPFDIRVDNERMRVIARAPTILGQTLFTVIRGTAGTTPALHGFVNVTQLPGSSRLTANVPASGAGSTTLLISGTSDAQMTFPAAPFIVRIGSELIRVNTKTTATQWAVTRGVNGTTATAHSALDIVNEVITDYYVVRSTTTGGARTAEWTATFSGVPAGSSALSLTYVGHNSIAGPTTTVTFWNWTTHAWQDLTPTPLTATGTSDSTVTRGIPVTGLGTGSNKGLVLIRIRTPGTTTTFNNFVDSLTLNYTAP
jgi:FtsP/CotA-like multicopper oxidase with cupredoxin domain